MTDRPWRRRLLPAALAALLAITALPSLVAASPRERILSTASAPAAHATAVDAGGNVHVAIERTDRHGIWYATDETGSWEVQRITRRHDVEPAITVSRGTAVIAFARLGNDGESNGIFTATRAGADWAIERGTDGVDRKPSIDAKGGVVHLAFQRAVREFGGSLEYMRLGARPWTVALYCCRGAPSLRLNSNGRPFIAFSLTYGGLVVGRRTDSGEWLNEVVDGHRTSAPRLVMAQRPTIGYLRKREGPTVRAWFDHQVNDTGSWATLDIKGGRIPFDLVVEGDEINAFTIGGTGYELEGRILWTIRGSDYFGGTNVVRGPLDVRSVEVERVGRGDGFIGTNVVIIYGRDDGVWTVS